MLNETSEHHFDKSFREKKKQTAVGLCFGSDCIGGVGWSTNSKVVQTTWYE
jgi:hypothetical protein